MAQASFGIESATAHQSDQPSPMPPDWPPGRQPAVFGPPVSRLDTPWPIVEYLQSLGCVATPEALYMAARRGHVEVVQRLEDAVDNNVDNVNWNKVVNAFAIGGCIAGLEWMDATSAT